MRYYLKTEPGLNEKIVRRISSEKLEPEWMLEFRLKALEQFYSMPLPEWGPNLAELRLDNIYYYIKPLKEQKNNWANVPQKIKKTFDDLGIPQAEQEMLAGVGAQFESEVIYKSLKKNLADQGVVFSDIESALQQHEDLIKKYFSTVVPINDNKFAALNSAVWSGGSFVYIPKDVKVDLPLQAYFRINQKSMGQFERTLIIAEPNSFVHYIEGCSAPVYSASSLHSAVVEIIALESSRVQYSTIQNWAPNIYNLVTKRAIAYKNSQVSWIDGNFGSKVTMKYPSVILKESGAQGDVLSIAVASNNQIQDSGGKVIHLAPNTNSRIVSKSISKDGGRTSYRGLVKVVKNAKDVKSRVQCDALMIGQDAKSDTYPLAIVSEPQCDIGHEASITQIDNEQLFFLASRGIPKNIAQAMIVNGFIEPFICQLPVEYAVELNKLILSEMEGSIG